MSMAGKLLK